MGDVNDCCLRVVTLKYHGGETVKLFTPISQKVEWAVNLSVPNDLNVGAIVIAIERMSNYTMDFCVIEPIE